MLTLLLNINLKKKKFSILKLYILNDLKTIKSFCHSQDMTHDLHKLLLTSFCVLFLIMCFVFIKSELYGFGIKFLIKLFL